MESVYIVDQVHHIPPASLGTPSVLQPGAIGSLMSSPSPQMQQPIETHSLSSSPSGCCIDYQGTVQGHVETPDDDDDNFDDMGADC